MLATVIESAVTPTSVAPPLPPSGAALAASPPGWSRSSRHSTPRLTQLDRSPSRVRFLLSLGLCDRGQGEAHREHGAGMGDVRGDVDPPVVHADDGGDDGQAESRAAAVAG